MWCIQQLTPEYRERMYRLLDLYKQPYNPRYPVVCMDEKSKQLLEDSRQPIKAKPGKLEKYDYEYKRRGTCNIFVAVAPKAGLWVVKVTDTRTKEDFAYFVEDLVEKHFSNATTKALSKSLLCLPQKKNKKICPASQKLNLPTHLLTEKNRHINDLTKTRKTLTVERLDTDRRRTTAYNNKRFVAAAGRRANCKRKDP